MTCRQAIALLMEYLEATLRSEDYAALEAHLNNCPECVAYLNTYRRTRDLMADAGRVEMPTEMKTRLGDFLRSRLSARSV